RLDVVPGGFEGGREKAFHYFPDTLGLRIRHLKIDLRELRLAVGTQILVAKATHDLEIAIEARDHKDLLEQLRRLRERIERSGLDPAWNQVIARAFGRGARHKGSFNFKKALRREIVANRQRHFVTEFDVE